MNLKFPLQLLFSVSLLLLSLQLDAQRPGGGGGRPGGSRGGAPQIKGNIRGEVVDADSGDAVDFATIVLLNASDSSQVDGTLTENGGKFKLEDISIGNYLLKVSFIGYEDKIIGEVNTDARRPDKDLNTIQLSANAVSLDAVEVSAQSALVENRIDKIVYNADQDITNAGGNAADVLRKVPLLSVDLEGNVSLRGSENITVLINGRPSAIFAGSIADALSSIPGDQIKKVEVITAPGARYDGEGSGGIINIITKRGEAQGFTSTVQTSIGTRQNNASLNLNAVKGRFGVNASASSFWSWRREGEFGFERTDFADNGTTSGSLMQNGNNGSRVLGIRSSGGAFYDFNAYNSINFSAQLNGFNRFRDGLITGELVNVTPASLINFNRDTDGENRRTGYDLTLDYRKTFPNQPDQEFILAFQLSGNDSESEDISLQNGDIERYQNDIFNFNDGRNLEYTGQIDYVHPFSPKLKLETGIKAILRRIDSDYRTSTRTDDNSPIIDVPLLTDLFLYDQDVLAGYLSFNFQLGDKWSLVSGGRFEKTNISGSYASENPDFKQDYNNFLPNLILNYKLSRFSGLKLSYSQRIQRPRLRFINPYSNVSDPNNISIGNPGLRPEMVGQVELAFNTYINGIVLNGAVYYRKTTDVIESFLEFDPNTDVGNTTFLNIGEQENIGFNFFSSVTLWEKLTLRGGFNVFNYSATGQRGGTALSREALLWNGNMSGSLTLGRGWTIESFGFFRSARQTLQGTNPSFSLFSMGIQKKLGERTTLGLRLVEPFKEDKPFSSELIGQNFSQTNFFTIPFRSIGISFSHRFGQIDFRERQRRSRIRNDDQKGDGDSNQF